MMISVVISINAMAETECPIKFGSNQYTDNVIAAIESKRSCSEASTIAEACAMGSSMDVQFVSSALKMCSKRINRSATIKRVVDSANGLCIRKFSKSEGTLAVSARAFCQLDVTKLYDDLLAPAEL